MAGSTTYPATVDNKTALQDGIDYMEADNVNNAYVPENATQTFIGANGKGASWSTDILDYLSNLKAPIVTKASASTLSVSTGAVMVKNSGQTNRIGRRNTSATTVTASDIDTGTLAVNYYYVFAVADTAATTFTVKFSLSSTAPTGLTNFELIGWFYNETTSAIDLTNGYVGNNKGAGRDVPNCVTVNSAVVDTVNDTSYGSDLTGAVIRFYSSGRPVEISFTSNWANAGDEPKVIVDIDGTDKTASERSAFSTSGTVDQSLCTIYMETLSAGTHTITIQAKVASGSDDCDLKTLIVKEL